MTGRPDGAEPPTGDDVHQLAARIDARMQEVSARLVLQDGRFAAMTDRLNRTDRRTDALSARADARLGAIDRRFDDLDARLERLDFCLVTWRDALGDLMREHEAALWRTTLIGLALNSAVLAALSAVTILVTL